MASASSFSVKAAHFTLSLSALPTPIAPHPPPLARLGPPIPIHPTTTIHPPFYTTVNTRFRVNLLTDLCMVVRYLAELITLILA